jgi:hypothetical protein
MLVREFTNTGTEASKTPKLIGCSFFVVKTGFYA